MKLLRISARLRAVWALALAVPLVSLISLPMAGCKKASVGTSAPEYGYDDYGGSGGDYAAAEGMGGMAAMDVEREYSKQRWDGDANEDYREEQAPPPEQPAPIDAPTPVEPNLEPKPEPGPIHQAAAKRQIIYTATMQVSVFDVAHAIAFAEALPEQLGGWLHQRSDNQLTLRIPAAQLEHAMALIAELGVVDQRLLEALDVTAQFTDLESRIKVLEQMQVQLQGLLAKAKDVEQALEIRVALDGITLELELLRGQMRELSKSIAFSTLVLRFVERGTATVTPSSNDPFTWVDELGVELTEYR